MTTPLNPCSPTTRSSSATAAGGSAIGSAAKPKNRVGWRRMPSASAAFVLRPNDPLFGAQLFNARRSQRQGLHIHAGSVHRRDAAVVNVDEPSDQGRDPPASPFR